MTLNVNKSGQCRQPPFILFNQFLHAKNYRPAGFKLELPKYMASIL